MASRINPSGFVIAGIGFFLTRFTVTLALYEEPIRFYAAGVLPLLLGLGLAAFGVALAVADLDAGFVRTTATWCVFGAGTMLVLVLLTLLGSAPGEGLGPSTIGSRAYLSNFLIGGSVGGTLTGLYAARNRAHRGALRQQANRLEVLNRLLRHEVLNALTVIRGYAAMDRDATADSRSVIEARADAIEGTIEEVKYLTRSAGPEAAVVPVAVDDAIDEAVATVRDRHPTADVTVERDDADSAVTANSRLATVFTHLVENAVVHGGERVSVDVTTGSRSVRVAVHDDGPGLPASQRSLLERGDIEDFDDPGTGFGLNIVRLLVESYDGTVETRVDGSGSTVTVVLPRADPGLGHRRTGVDDLAAVEAALPNLLVTLLVAVLASVVYGLGAQLQGGSVGVIGVFYGLQDPVVGWITHTFHSVVFGFVYAGLLTLAPDRYRHRPLAHVGIGLGWALTLWLLAAGVVAPVWLRLLGIPATVPSLSLPLLVNHLLWGVTMGLGTAVGFDRLSPWLGRRLR